MTSLWELSPRVSWRRRSASRGGRENRADRCRLVSTGLRAMLFRSTSARHRIRHGIRHTAARAGRRHRLFVANDRLRHTDRLEEVHRIRRQAPRGGDPDGPTDGAAALSHLLHRKGEAANAYSETISVPYRVHSLAVNWYLASVSTPRSTAHTQMAQSWTRLAVAAR